jgi:putative two-component system response regulator
MKKVAKILVVDDEVRNLELIEALLAPLGHDIILAHDGEEALNEVERDPPDLILLDIMMPKINGLEVAKKIKEDEDKNIIPIVMVTALKETEDRVKALQVGADDFLSKPLDKTELRARVQSLLKVKAYNDHMRNYQKELEAKVAKRTEKLKNAFEKLEAYSLDTIHRLTRAAEYKDEDTGAHIQRMSRYSAEIARHMGLGENVSKYILYAAPMHDIGKIGIPDSILLKPGKLDPDEWEIMKRHTIFGGEILKGAKSGYLKLGEVIAMSHHEKWDGSGYPKGLKGKKIPKVGQIVAIADVFDALTSKRPYKEAFPLEKSFAIIREGRSNHFAPDVVDAFFAVKNEILSINEKYKDNEESIFFQLRNKMLNTPSIHKK